MKKIIVLALAAILSFGIGGNAFAMSSVEENDSNITWNVIEEDISTDYKIPEETIGVSYINPDPVFVTYSIDRPEKVWDIKSKGQYDFAGTSKGSTLYTNYKFKGKTSYTIKINNTGSDTITLKAKRLTKTYASTKVSKGKSATIQFSDIKSDTEFYITFEGASLSFDGYIK
jgi:hypothetical protein